MSGESHDTTQSSLVRMLGSIEGKQDYILLRLDQQDRERANLQNQVDGIDRRVSRVEGRLSYFAGGLAIITALAVLLKDKIRIFITGG